MKIWKNTKVTVLRLDFALRRYFRQIKTVIFPKSMKNNDLKIISFAFEIKIVLL